MGPAHYNRQLVSKLKGTCAFVLAPTSLDLLEQCYTICTIFVCQQVGSATKSGTIICRVPNFILRSPNQTPLESGETTRRRASQNMTTSGQKREPSKQTRLSQVGELDGSADQSGHNNMKNERMIRGGAL